MFVFLIGQTYDSDGKVPDQNKRFTAHWKLLSSSVSEA